jgi:uncharacterized protein (TIGR01244 family)
MSDASGLDHVAATISVGAHAYHGVVTGGQPEAHQIGDLASANVRTVIDLRMPDEDRGFDAPAAVTAAGMSYVTIPVPPTGPDTTAFDRVREVLRDTANRPAILHCKSANRAGAVLLPYLILDEGMPEAEAVEVAVTAGLKVEALKDLALQYVAANKG